MKVIFVVLLSVACIVGLLCVAAQADENDHRRLYELWQKSFPERQIEYQDWKKLKNNRLL